MSQCPKTTNYSKRLPEGPLYLNPTSDPTPKLSIAYLNLPKSSKTAGSAPVQSKNEYDSVSTTHSYLTSHERLETQVKQRPMSTSQNTSTNTIDSPFASSYYKNISKIKGQSPIASYYRNKQVVNRKLIKVAVLNKQREYGGHSHVQVNTSRTEGLATGWQQVGQREQDTHSPKLGQNGAPCENYPTTKVNFVSLNPVDTDNNIKVEEWMSKTGDRFHRRDTSFNAKYDNSLDRTPKIEHGNKGAARNVDSQVYTNLNTRKGRIVSSRVNSYVKNAYRIGPKNIGGRENHIGTAIGIERQRSEANHIYNRKKLIEKDLTQSPLTQVAQDNVDNHVTKFSYATKAGKSVRNPNK